MAIDWTLTRETLNGIIDACGSAGKSIESQVKVPAGIARKWMFPSLTKAITLAGQQGEAADGASRRPDPLR